MLSTGLPLTTGRQGKPAREKDRDGLHVLCKFLGIARTNQLFRLQSLFIILTHGSTVPHGRV
mgnify:CR=1 FL=1